MNFKLAGGGQRKESAIGRVEGRGQVHGADHSSQMEEGGSQEVVADVSGPRDSVKDREARQQLGEVRRIRERSRSPLQKKGLSLKRRQDNISWKTIFLLRKVLIEKV